MVGRQFTRLELWNETKGRWWLAHAGIDLLDPRLYVERLAANGKAARATVLGPNLESLEVIQSEQPVQPSATAVDDWEEDERESLPDGFVPALNKLEAVNRLSAAVGAGAETLGPGSKERKSVLEKLGRALDLDTSVLMLPKTKLASSLAAELRQPWDRDCFSSGETVTLVGLNVLLHGAERRFPSRVSAAGVLEEAHRIAAIVEPVLRQCPRFELKAAVTQMRLEESRQWRQSQWPGWYFEHIALPPCFGALGGSPRKSPTTVFDFSANQIWDFKAHSDRERTAPLNDQVATHWALDEGGLGFVMLTGHSEFEDWAKPWLDQQKALYPAKQRKASDREPRPSGIKSAFTPTRLDFFYFEDQAAWGEAIDAGIIKGGFQEGWNQYDGKTPRKAKYSLILSTALVSRYLLFSVELKG